MSEHEELIRRQRLASMVVAGVMVLTLLLVVIAFVAKDSILRPGNDPTLPMALWIVILFFGMGAFVLRRTRFNAMRLQDIAGVRGISGLLTTLQETTIQLALIAAAIALLGFIITIRTGNSFDMLRAGGVAIIVLLYCYPRQTAWQRVVQGIEQSGDADNPPEDGLD